MKRISKVQSILLISYNVSTSLLVLFKLQAASTWQRLESRMPEYITSLSKQTTNRRGPDPLVQRLLGAALCAVIGPPRPQSRDSITTFQRAWYLAIEDDPHLRYFWELLLARKGIFWTTV